MRALVYEQFRGPLAVRELPDPQPLPGGVVVAVRASGICRSDRHAWEGHDPGVALPHVPGHELAGQVVAMGAGVRGWSVGDRVTAPFVNACGRCRECAAGAQQVCTRQTQPGFTHHGALAEFVRIDAAEVNLVRLPDDLDDVAAAGLGCRFATAFRAVAHVGRVRPGEWLVVHGCGGVGLSAVQVGVAAGARVVAVDPAPGARAMATAMGAEHALAGGADVVDEVRALTDGGADVSLDAFGSAVTCAASVGCLRPRGRHVQVGLLPPEQARSAVPADLVVARELAVLGSHGAPAHAYPELLGLVAAGRLRPQDLVTRRIRLDDAGAALVDVGAAPGTAVVTAMR